MKPLFRRKLSNNVFATLEYLLESQFWPADKVREYQWKKIQNLLTHAFKNVPYYRDMFGRRSCSVGDITNFDDFAQLPVLGKKDIQQSFEKMVASNVDKQQLTLNSTGGSTGMPLNFYQDQRYEVWADAARWRAWRYMPGGDRGSLEAVLWGAVRDVGHGFSYVQKFREIMRDGVLQLNTFDIDYKLLKQYLIWYNRLRPSLLRGYASSLYYVANHIEKNGLKIHNPLAVISSTEVLHSRMRKQIERVFGAPVFDSYGCREVSQIGTECKEHDGFHIVFENQYVEVVNGEILVTNLNNYGMPLIRYAVGDLAQELNYQKCSCGRYSPRIINLSGRDNDNIELPSGTVINGEFFEFLFFGMGDVVQYQVTYSRSKEILIVKLQLNQGGSFDKVKQSIEEAMISKYNFTNIDVEESDMFDKTPTGKLRFVYMVD